LRKAEPPRALPHPPPMNLYKAIFLTLLSALLFAAMSALVRFSGAIAPVGQVVFFRAFFAIFPVLLIYALRRELYAAIHTKRPLGHVGRGLFGVGGMFCNFASLARLPLVDATAFSFTSPLITVVFAAIFLKERVRIYRWSAVIVGFIGVLVMLWPQFDPSHFSGSAGQVAAIGSLFAIAAALFNAGAVIQTRRLTDTEATPSIVFYFSLICSIGGLLTLPFGWIWPQPVELMALVSTGLLGGLAHIFLTESYRHAPQSVVAPFGYTSMIWALVLGYVFFGEVPATLVFIGAAIVAGAGLFVIHRERQLGLHRPPEPPAGTPPAAG
jgi:drug/metabolite transporter (DMT)-like permease